MVNCWILRDTQDQAKAVAYGWIGDQDWRIIEVEAATLMTKESLEGNSRGLQYFQQAEIDNEVFVFHTWPRREPDDRSVG